MIIGSHVSVSAPNYLLGSVEEALSYGANTFMFYTGAPQNTLRKKVSELKVAEFKDKLIESGIDINNLIIHAPYIINLANTEKKETFELAVSFLKEEIKRALAIGVKKIVLHPGSCLKASREEGIAKIISGLNLVLEEKTDIIICLETMAGKGSEIGVNFAELKSIYDGVIHKENIGICLDTCHLNDAGYDLHDFDQVLSLFEKYFSLDMIKVIHVNDSKNVINAHKDRHANIGFGTIGFTALSKIVHHPKLKNVPKILETPYYEKKAPYKKEIKMLLDNNFDSLIENLI